MQKAYKKERSVSGFMFTLLCLSILALLASGCADTPAPTSETVQNGTTPTEVTSAGQPVTRPLALVYRGEDAGCRGCSEAAAALLKSSKWNFDVQFIGPDEQLQLTEDVLKTAALYVQPGGDASVRKAYSSLREEAEAIQSYVTGGGRYLGLCMGAYLAGSSPGFKLLPGDTDQFIASAGASVTTEDDTLVEVRWRGQLRHMYFQDGPYFKVRPDAQGVTVLAEYTNGKIAALVAPYGEGKVGVSGPHPEATAAWYNDYHLVNPEGLTADLGHDLIDTLMQ